MAKKYSMNRNSLRNLPQYRELTDEEFDAKFPVEEVKFVPRDDQTEEKITKLLKDFEENYDLTEMLPNDMVILKNLAHAMVSLDEYQNTLTQIRRSGVSEANISLVDTLSRVCTGLRTDISRMQDDLKITRKTRKTEKVESVMQEVDNVIQKGRKFYQEKMLYIFCDHCGILLGTIWSLYKDTKNDTLVLECRHKREDGTICGNKQKVNLTEIRNSGGSNRLDLMPERMR